MDLRSLFWIVVFTLVPMGVACGYGRMCERRSGK